MIEFPRGNIEYETVTTANFLRNIYRIIKVKTHLHHSRTTGKILGYVHEFCNRRVRENKTKFSCIAYNLFGFDIHFFIRVYRATAWNSKNLNFRGTGLTRINFAKVNNIHKFIDTHIINEVSLTKTATEEEKEAIKKLAVRYITNHD